MDANRRPSLKEDPEWKLRVADVLGGAAVGAFFYAAVQHWGAMPVAVTLGILFLMLLGGRMQLPRERTNRGNAVPKKSSALILSGTALLAFCALSFTMRSGVFVGDPTYFGGYPVWARLGMAAGAALIVAGAWVGRKR